MIELFSAAPGLQTPTTARTWAYSILGAFQVVTVMWLGSDYSDRDTVAADLTALLWPGIELAGTRRMTAQHAKPTPALTDPTPSTQRSQRAVPPGLLR